MKEDRPILPAAECSAGYKGYADIHGGSLHDRGHQMRVGSSKIAILRATQDGIGVAYTRYSKYAVGDSIYAI